MKKWITSKYFYKLLVSFLLIGVMPLLIIGPIAYALTKSILYKRVYNQSEIFIQAVDESFRDTFDASLSMMNSIMEDDAFETLFHSTEEDGRVYLYEALYTLLSTQKNRPSIHIVNADFDVVMSTDPTPKEYYQKAFRSWGVMRKALLAKGNPVTYYYTISSDETRVVTLARAKYTEDGELEGVVFVDHHEEGLRDLIPPNNR
jgi:two-component system sensor histidine kinase YesM